MLFKSHMEMRDVIDHHFNINGSKEVDDLNERDKQQLAIAALLDNQYFDGIELLLWENDPKRNLICVLQAYYNGEINGEQAIKDIFNMITEASKRQFNKIFDECINAFEDEERSFEPVNNVDSIDFTHGFY